MHEGEGLGGHWREPLSIAAMVLLVDQLTKVAVAHWMPRFQSIPIIDGFFNLVHVRNPGAAFSLLADAPAWFRGPFLIIITLVAVGFLLSFVRRLGPEKRGLRIALGLILGGAVGNLVDRLIRGEVVDFIDLYWGTYHWPAFNVADSCISIAVVFILLDSFRSGSEGEEVA